MKTFALFISILVGYLAARKSEPAFSDFKFDVQKALADLEQSADYSLSSAATRIPLQIGQTDSTPTAPIKFGTKYDDLIVASSENAGIPATLLYRLLNQESRFRDDIITGKTRSNVGALGIAQFMPATAVEWLGSEDAALDPKKAIPGAAKYLAWLIRRFNGDQTKAVAAYNWGIGNVQRKGLDAAPQETRKYVQAILPGTQIG